ncbi:MAG: flagellar motor protein MotB [Actinomycetota bacterium]|nr:flagellar motor protein MotB [Actinomycetota bacterium]
MSAKGHTAPPMHHPRKKHEEEAGEHSERWLLTYSDMITLLMVLFVVLFAMSTISVRKFMEFRTGVVQAFSPQINNLQQGGTGILSQNALVSAPGSQAARSAISSPANNGTSSAVSLTSELQKSIQQAGVANSVSVFDSSQGVTVRILTDKVFFASDSATIQSSGLPVLAAIAKIIAPLPNNIEVQGNTDNAPIVGGPFSSNLQLSAMRAVNVVQDLVASGNVDPARISATGFGDTRPLYPNDTPQHMAQNRRVDIVILNSAISTGVSNNLTTTPTLAPNIAPTLTTVPSVG